MIVPEFENKLEKSPSDGPSIAWTPSVKQRLLLRAPVFELLAWGNRGGGKSDWLLMDFAQDIGHGLGRDWRGIILRTEIKDLTDIIDRSKKWFYKLFPGAVFRSDALEWTFPDDERLVYRHAKRSDDIRKLLGQEWPWQAWDELCSWPQPDLYFDIQSCARSANPRIAPRIRAATNPWGPGAWWVKDYFIDRMKQGEVFRDMRTVGAGDTAVTHPITRAHLRMDFLDNSELANNDPTYLHRLRPTDPAKKSAWVEGLWDLAVGGFFSGVWNRDAHVLKPFRIPVSWRIDRAHDWGASSPHSTLWFAESDGTSVEVAPGQIYTFKKGTLFVIGETYGWNGSPNKGRGDTDHEIAAEIRSKDSEICREHGRARVIGGPADTQIFSAPQGKAIIDTYRNLGVDFRPADKSSGSRVTGAKAVLDRLIAASEFGMGRPMEEPGLFVFSTCVHTIRTLPKLQRDEKQPDDVDSDGEDHCYDVIRYRCLAERRMVVMGRF